MKTKSRVTDRVDTYIDRFFELVEGFFYLIVGILVAVITIHYGDTLVLGILSHVVKTIDTM